jgi:hypothetical protein
MICYLRHHANVPFGVIIIILPFSRSLYFSLYLHSHIKNNGLLSIYSCDIDTWRCVYHFNINDESSSMVIFFEWHNIFIIKKKISLNKMIFLYFLEVKIELWTSEVYIIWLMFLLSFRNCKNDINIQAIGTRYWPEFNGHKEVNLFRIVTSYKTRRK